MLSRSTSASDAGGRHCRATCKCFHQHPRAKAPEPAPAPAAGPAPAPAPVPAPALASAPATPCRGVRAAPSLRPRPSLSRARRAAPSTALSSASALPAAVQLRQLDRQRGLTAELSVSLPLSSCLCCLFSVTLTREVAAEGSATSPDGAIRPDLAGSLVLTLPRPDHSPCCPCWAHGPAKAAKDRTWFHAPIAYAHFGLRTCTYLLLHPTRPSTCLSDPALHGMPRCRAVQHGTCLTCARTYVRPRDMNACERPPRTGFSGAPVWRRPLQQRRPRCCGGRLSKQRGPSRCGWFVSLPSGEVRQACLSLERGRHIYLTMQL